jgi:hypothetical protein
MGVARQTMLRRPGIAPWQGVARAIQRTDRSVNRKAGQLSLETLEVAPIKTFRSLDEGSKNRELQP